MRNQVTRFGGARLWARRLDLPYPERRPGYETRWTVERVRADLKEFLRGRDHWPSRLDFEAAGRKPLRDAVRRLGGHEHWAAEFGLPLVNLKAGSRRIWTERRIEEDLRKILAGRDSWPAPEEFEHGGTYGLATAVRRNGGTAHWAHRLGVQPPRMAQRACRPRIWD